MEILSHPKGPAAHSLEIDQEAQALKVLSQASSTAYEIQIPCGGRAALASVETGPRAQIPGW